MNIKIDGKSLKFIRIYQQFLFLEGRGSCAP